MNPEWRSRYEAAVGAAREAGDLARDFFERPLEVERKADQSPVTVADRAAEERLRDRLLGAFPDDGFLGEESGDRPGGSGFRWVIDPIDGTRSFVRQIPLWGTLVGLEYRGEVIAGVAYAPALGQLYHALRGDGAYRDGTPIAVSQVSRLADALMAYTSISWFQKAGRERAFLELVRRTDGQRGYGDFYGFVLLAQGSCDIMIDHGVSAWDMAAVQPIVEEAGGRFSGWDGERSIYRSEVLATNGRLHDEVLEILRAGD